MAESFLSMNFPQRTVVELVQRHHQQQELHHMDRKGEVEVEHGRLLELLRQGLLRQGQRGDGDGEEGGGEGYQLGLWEGYQL
ncbi:hypothetical protein PS2_044761 [Malus domestica]